MTAVIFPARIVARPGTPAAHQLAKNAADFFRSLACHTTLPEGVYGLTVDNKIMFRGDVLFELKTTHGFPLDFALDRIINESGGAIDWVAFIEAARRGGWWDYQTFEATSHAMVDAMLPLNMQASILQRFKLYVLANPHPRMTK